MLGLNKYWPCSLVFSLWFVIGHQGEFFTLRAVPPKMSPQDLQFRSGRRANDDEPPGLANPISCSFRMSPQDLQTLFSCSCSIKKWCRRASFKRSALDMSCKTTKTSVCQKHVEKCTKTYHFGHISGQPYRGIQSRSREDYSRKC